MEIYAKPIKAKGILFSQISEDPKDVLIIKPLNDNKFIAEYNGVKCLSIFLKCSGLYYLDDIYRRLDDKASNSN